MFKKCDSNGDGVIDQGEFVGLVELLSKGQKPDAAEVEKRFKAIDTNSEFYYIWNKQNDCSIFHFVFQTTVKSALTNSSATCWRNKSVLNATDKP